MRTLISEFHKTPSLHIETFNSITNNYNMKSLLDLITMMINNNFKLKNICKSSAKSGHFRYII